MRILAATLLILPLLLLGCATPGTEGTQVPDGPGGPDPASLTEIHMYNTALGVGDYRVDITTTGDMTVQERRGATAADLRRSTMHLTPDQIDSLQKVFKGWKKLKATYPGDWAQMVQITYDGYTVEVHDLPQAPANFTAAMATLVKLAQQAVAASTNPATAPAPRN